MAAEEDRERIQAAARDVVLVDGHAHNLVELDSSFSFLHAFTEAGDDVLENVPHTIPFKRGIEDIAGLYRIDASLETIEKHRKSVGLDVLGAKCFEAANIDTLLLDDGLAFEKIKDLAWHRCIVSKVYRILRIETVAEEILNKESKFWNVKLLERQFVSTLNSLLSSVVAFKSIAAYRSGLNIDPAVTDRAAEEGLFADIRLAESKKVAIRLQNKNIIDRLFVRALEVATSHGIPMQIHTGFGDKDLDLRLANPLHLRAVLEDQRFCASRLVLLHASYPYMREATYLSSVYSQVFLDFGLAIPKLTVRGMKTAISELLELAPINKVMFSTDGYAFPETYFLGAKWARTILAQVLCDAYDDGDLSADQAIGAAEALLRTNSLAFYKLEEEHGRSSLKYAQKVKLEAVQNHGQNGHSSPIKLEAAQNHCQNGDSSSIEMFLTPSSVLDNAKYVRILWGDNSGQRRCRVVPSARYKAVVMETGVGLAECAIAMSSFSDVPAPGSGLSVAGEIRLIPDATTERYVPQWGHGVVLGDMHSKPGTPWEYCPRSTLRRLVHLLHEEFGLVLRAGFETEFYLLRETNDHDRYEGIDFSSYCSTDGLNRALPTIDSVLSWLEAVEVDIEQFHPEAGGGQFEIALAHQLALRSADNLLLAREAITAAAISHNFIATFLPKLHLKNTAVGTGCHCHLSVWKDGKNVLGTESISDSNNGISETGRHFIAGVLQHLPAVLAIVAPSPNSYERIRPNAWSGAYQCWGHQNREAPLRAVPDIKSGVVNNFELKSFDGCANPHLGLAAIIAAGMDGLRKRLELPPPIPGNPAELEVGRVARLPTKLEEATKSLENDDVLKKLLGEKLVTAIVAIRKVDAEDYKGQSIRNLIHKF